MLWKYNNEILRIGIKINFTSIKRMYNLLFIDNIIDTTNKIKYNSDCIHIWNFHSGIDIVLYVDR
jgi:hypothetical protein